MANNRKVVINVHSSENKAPDAGILNYGEIAVSHSSKKNAALYTKTSDGAVAKFISEDAIKDEIGKISAHTDDLVGIVQNLANLTITDIKTEVPISATTKALVASSCGNTVTISHVANKKAQSGFKKLTTDTYGHVTDGENVVIGDISGLTGFEEAIKGAETKLAYSSAGTGNAVTSISVNDHTITANFGKKFSENGHKHDGSDITSGKVGIDFLPTSTAVNPSSDDTTIPTSKAVYDAVSGVVNGLDKTASSAQGQFVRTVIQENGLVSENKDFITANDIKLSAVTPSSTTVKEEYALYNGNGAQLGDRIKIYKDQSLVSITLEDKDESKKPGQYLKYTYIDASGNTQSTYVDVSKLLVEAEFKDGVTADSNGIVHGVVDSASESFLTVGAGGFKLSGVQNAINSAINGLDSTGTTSEFHAITSITITDGKITEVGQTDKINSAITSVSAETIDLSGVKNADDLKAIEALTATSGILRKTGENAWDLANVVTSLDGVASNGSLVDALTVKNAINGVDTKLQELSGSVETFSAATVAEIKRVEDKLSADEKVIAESINQLGAKVDKTQKGAGLNEDGSYAPHSTANYIAGATSLDDADIKLDSAVKALAESMTGSTADLNELSGQVQTLSGSVVSIKNREQNYASAITINGHTHTVANNSVDLGSFLSANTAHITAIQQVSNASAVTTTINYVTENGSASAATITQDLIIDCGTY